MRTGGRRVVGAAVIVALAIGFAGCRRTTISRILAEPDRYREDEVGLEGEVVQSVSLLGRGAYQLDDGTGTIWVVSTRGVPRQGARVAVKGRVRDVVDLGTLVPLPPQVGSGLVLVAEEHRAR